MRTPFQLPISHLGPILAIGMVAACSEGSGFEANESGFPEVTDTGTTTQTTTLPETTLSSDDDNEGTLDDNEGDTTSDESDDASDDDSSTDDENSTTSTATTSQTEDTSTGSTNSSATDTATSTSGDTSSTATGTDTASSDSSSDSSSETHDTGSQTPIWLIDDFEDSDDMIFPVDGRIGAWYTYNDESVGGKQTPAVGKDVVPEAAMGSGHTTLVARTFGSGFSEWGAGLGFDLKNPSNKKMSYDASAYEGIQFLARGIPNERVRVLVETKGVLPVADGGTCVDDPNKKDDDCLDSHGVFIELDDQWRAYLIKFSGLTQEGWGQSVPFQAREITAVQFNFEVNKSFDFAIDDVTFAQK